MSSHGKTLRSIACLLPLSLGVLAGCAPSGSIGADPMPTETRAASDQPVALATAHVTDASPSPTPQREPPSLAHIAFGSERPDVNMKTLGQWSGVTALDGLLPAGERESTAAMLVEARRYEFVGPLDSANPRATQAHFVTYALRFASARDATQAYTEIVASLEGSDHWRSRQMTASAELGDSSAAFWRVGTEGRESLAHVWHRADLVLAILGLDDSDRAAVYDTARRMDERVR